MDGGLSSDVDRDDSIINSLADEMRFHNTAEGRKYICGLFVANETTKILTALNRGGLLYKSMKYDEKFATLLIDSVVRANETVEENILRNFIGGEH